jgi:hypothetical protein
MEAGIPCPATTAAAEEADTAHGKTNKSQHNAVFCAWVCRVFGQEFLRTKRGVADVAGGQGYLSYELCIRYVLWLLNSRIFCLYCSVYSVCVCCFTAVIADNHLNSVVLVLFFLPI